MSNFLNAGVIGLGVGKRHLDLYNNHKNISKIKVYDFNLDLVKSLIKKYPRVTFCNEANDILKDEDTNMVSIASYDNYHHEQILIALEHNKHVLIEKPLCLNEKQLIDISKKVDQKPNLIVSTNFVLRSNPYFKFYKKLIENEELGKIYHIEGAYNYGRLEKITSGWRGELENYSVSHGGGIHIIDLILWLTNDKIIDCSSTGNKFLTQGLKFTGYDNIISILKFNNGITSKISSNFGSVTPHYHELSIYGTKGTIIHNHENSIWYKGRGDSDKINLKIPVNNSYKENIINNFIDSISEIKNLQINFNDIKDAMAVSIAIEKSLNSNKFEKVKYI